MPPVRDHVPGNIREAAQNLIDGFDKTYETPSTGLACRLVLVEQLREVLASSTEEAMMKRLYDALVAVTPFLDYGDADVELRSEVANLRGILANG